MSHGGILFHRHLEDILFRPTFMLSFAGLAIIMPHSDVTAGHYYSQLMTTAHASCPWPAAARFTEHGQLGIVTCYRPASSPTGHAPCSVMPAKYSIGLHPASAFGVSVRLTIDFWLYIASFKAYYMLICPLMRSVVCRQSMECCAVLLLLVVVVNW